MLRPGAFQSLGLWKTVGPPIGRSAISYGIAKLKGRVWFWQPKIKKVLFLVQVCIVLHAFQKAWCCSKCFVMFCIQHSFKKGFGFHEYVLFFNLGAIFHGICCILELKHVICYILDPRVLVSWKIADSWRHLHNAHSHKSCYDYGTQGVSTAQHALCEHGESRLGRNHVGCKQSMMLG